MLFRSTFSFAVLSFFVFAVPASAASKCLLHSARLNLVQSFSADSGGGVSFGGSAVLRTPKVFNERKGSRAFDLADFMERRMPSITVPSISNEADCEALIQLFAETLIGQTGNFMFTLTESEKAQRSVDHFELVTAVISFGGGKKILFTPRSDGSGVSGYWPAPTASSSTYDPRATSVSISQ